MEKDEVLALCASPLSQEDADRLYESEFWQKQKWTYMELAELQLNQEIGIMPAAILHTALDNALGRPVYQNELEDMDALYVELCEKKARAVGLHGQSDIDQSSLQKHYQPNPQPQPPPKPRPLITEEIDHNPPDRFSAQNQSSRWIELGRSRPLPAPEAKPDGPLISETVLEPKPAPEPQPQSAPARVSAPPQSEPVSPPAPAPTPTPAPQPAPKRETVPWKPATLDI